MGPKIHGQYDGEEARPRRHAAVAAALDRFPEVRRRFEAAYGMRLPRHLAYGAAFFLGLSSQERALCPPALFAFTEWFDWLAPGEAERIATLDERLEGRWRRDVPEMVTIAAGGGDGSHWGLFYDLPGELPRIVAHGYARDDGAVWQAGTTLLGAIRGDLRPEGLDQEERRRMRGLLGWLDALHAEELRAHAEEGIGAPFSDRLDGGPSGLGPYLPGYRLPEALAGASARLDALASWTPEAQAWVARAREELAQGRGELALVLGRELHFLDADVTREIAAELLPAAYEALGRPQLAEIARVHHRHRDLPTVAIYRTAEQIAAAEEEPYVEPPLAVAAGAVNVAEVKRILAEGPPDQAIDAALYRVLPSWGPASEEALGLIGLILDHAGVDAASRVLGYALVRASACAGPDLLEKAGRPRADRARELFDTIVGAKDRAVVELLLGRGARPEANRDCEHAVQTGDAGILARVLRLPPAGFDPKAHRTTYYLHEDTSRPAGGATLLHLAVCTASVEMVRAVLALGLDPDVADDAGKTARDLAKALWMVRPREGGAMMDLFGRPPAAAAPPAAPAEWEAGAAVQHPKFGAGIVTGVSGSGPEAKIGVKFAAGEKTLLAKFLKRAREG